MLLGLVNTNQREFFENRIEKVARYKTSHKAGRGRMFIAFHTAVKFLFASVMNGSIKDPNLIDTTEQKEKNNDKQQLVHAMLK